MSWLNNLKTNLRGTGSKISTVDAAKAAPPPSPLAPVDLTNPAHLTGVMEIAARIGEILISSGNSNSDVRAQIHSVLSAYGLYRAHVDITTKTITIHANIGTINERIPVNVFRVAPDLTVDFSKLTAVDRLIRSIQSGATPPERAEQILDDIMAEVPPHSPKMVNVGWGMLGGGVSVMLGGDAAVGILAFIISFAIMATNSWLSKFRLPAFYQNVVGGFIATVPAAGFYTFAGNIGWTFSPSYLIASGIIVLVAGLTLVQCFVDGITGAPVSSAARLFEAILMTGAIVGGVALGIQFAILVGWQLPPLEHTSPPNAHEIPLRIVLGALSSAGFAFACQARRSAVAVAGATAGAGMVFYYGIMVPLGAGVVLASGVTAGIIGLAGGLLARRYEIPPLIVAVCGYTPMLPGLMLYRGMYAMINEQAIVGFSNAGGAIAISAALAAGVVFGEKVARNLRRPRSYRAYAAVQRAGRFSYRQAAKAAAKGSSAARRIPRGSSGTNAGKQASASNSATSDAHTAQTRPSETQTSQRKTDRT